MSLEVGLEIQQDPISICAKDAKSNCRCFSNHDIHDDGPKEDEARPIVAEQKEEPAYCMTIEEDEEKNGEGEWYSNILQYLKDRTYPKLADKNDQLIIRRLSTNYIIYGERLYKRSYDGIHLLCVTAKEV